MLPKRKRKKKPQANNNSNAYKDVKQEYLESPEILPPPSSSTIPPPSLASDSSSSDEAGVSEVRLRASEKRDILLYYILENFYTIDEAHKNTLYAFLLKLSESKAIDFDPFVQPGLYSHFRKHLDVVMLDIRAKASVQPLLHGIHSSNYSNNISRAAIDFESECFLGKGGFGEVIKVRNRIDGMMYALKKVRFRDLPNSAKNLEKVLREVKALAQLDHENVLRYYNAWIEVEHAGDYTKKMLETVSHRPHLPVPLPPSLSPSLPLPLPLPLPLQPTMLAEFMESKIGEVESGGEDGETESSEGMPCVGTMYGCATSTTEDEDGEEDRESESESEYDSEGGGVEFEVVDSSQSSSSHAMLHGINTIKIDERTKSGNSGSGDTHNIYSIHSSSTSSSSHSNMHGINTKITKITKKTTKIIQNYSSESDNSSHGLHLPTKRETKVRVRRTNVLSGISRRQFKTNSINSNNINIKNNNNYSLPTSSFAPPPLRLSSELVYAKGKLTRSRSAENKLGPASSGDFGPTIRTMTDSDENDSESDAAGREEFGKGETEDESEEWGSGGTSGSKNFSNEVSTPPNNKQIVPFTGGIPNSPPPPPKNRYVLYIQMQLCESKTLKSFLERPDRQVNIMENMNMFHQIVSGLHHIHSRGLIHRDLKPDNIFFTASGTIKIGDFGLSKQFCEEIIPVRKLFDDDSSPHTMGIGTKSYASPEQIRSNFYCEKSDVYSLGIILFELFNVFATYTERAKVLQEVRQGIIPSYMWSRFPDVARYVLWLMDDVAENRPDTSDILQSSFMTLSEGPCSVTSLVVKQKEEIERLQEKIMKLELELKLGSSP